MTNDLDLQSLILESATRILRDSCDPQTVNVAFGDGWKEPLWRDLEESGLTLCWIAEDKGGAGVPLAVGFEVLFVAGRFAIPVPLSETMIAGWLLSAADIPVPEGSITLSSQPSRQSVNVDASGKLSGTVTAVPFAGEADYLAVCAPGEGGPIIALAAMQDCTPATKSSFSGDPKGDVGLDGVIPVASAPMPFEMNEEALLMFGAAARSRQIAGALQAILDLSVSYARERVAFGRPIGKFQAVQHNLARLAGEVAAANAASGSACDTITRAGSFDETVFLEAASAKIRAGEAAGEGAAIAHQVFGAIGFTQEHVLHRYTRRLWGWRDDFGSESEWAEKLGRRVVDAGADELWPMLAAR
ncbi:MAG: acyl-CoA/acyl-ACP dehydrogenase [Hyphomicrobiaceae bacterium]|nr:acyl-CoA/acyl-ACP dehydrogenase [Hyphomicrobiaceae bacterium]